MQSASDIYAEAISREQDIANQLLKAPYAVIPLLAFRSSRLGADKAVAGMFIYTYVSRPTFVKYPIRFNPRVAGVRDVHRISPRLRHWGNSHEGRLTNVQERSNKSHNLGRSSL